MPKLLSLVQPNFQQGPKQYNAFQLPYSVGLLWAFARTSEVVQNAWSLDQIVWRRQDLDQTATTLATNHLVAFSTYVWNRYYNYSLAKKIKELNPAVTIIFGGPEPPIADPDIFKLHPYIDIVVKHEGEQSFQLILAGEDLANIPGLLLNQQGMVHDTGSSVRVTDLNKLPSPYISGVFDDIIANNPDVEWNATLETNRGCPYQCTFCDWGSLTYSKVHHFELNRVFAELEWIGSHRIGHLSFADANFGMFVDRDHLIAEKLVEVQKNTAYPRAYTISWAKNTKPHTLETAKFLVDSGNSKTALTLSLQSLNPDTLSTIKRKNVDSERIDKIFKMCERNHVPVYTELILGLPNETVASWKNNFWKLFEAGNHTGITVYQAQLLTNAEMNMLQKKLHHIQSRPVYDYFDTTEDYNLQQESIDVVVATRTMPYDHMLDSWVFAWFISTFHINGLSNLLSRFVTKYCGITYSKFYEDLWQHVQADHWWAEQILQFKQLIHQWFDQGKIDPVSVQGVQVNSYNLILITTYQLHAQRKISHTFNMLAEFCQQYHIASEIVHDLFVLQQTSYIDHERLNHYPITQHIHTNIMDYLTSDIDLVTKPCTVQFVFNDNTDMPLNLFLEKIYFNRRTNFGKAFIHH